MVEKYYKQDKDEDGRLQQLICIYYNNFQLWCIPNFKLSSGIGTSASVDSSLKFHIGKRIGSRHL